MLSYETREPERCRDSSVKQAPALRSLRRGIAAAATFAACLAAGTAMADQGSANLVNVLSKTIEIESDGQHYTKPANFLQFIAADVRVALDAEISGRIRSYEVWLKFRAENTDWVSLPQYGYAQTFPLGDRPKTLDKVISLGIPSASYGSHLVDYCEQQAADLRQGGMSDQAIFSQDRPLEVGLLPALKWDMSGANNSYNASGLGAGWPFLVKMTVVCKASKSDPQRLPTADNGPTRKDPVLESLSLLVIEKDSLRGACSLQLAGTVKTKKPNTEAKFRFESDDGHKSDVKTVTTGSVSTRQYSYDYPLSPGGTKIGKIRVVAVGENVASDWKDYEVNCGSPAQDVATLLPPKAISVEIIPTGEEIVHRGYACPATAKIYGVLKGRGKSKGGAALFAGGKLNTLAQYDVQDDESVVIQGDYTFDWANKQSVQQNVKSVFRLTNLSQDVVDEIENTQNFTCRKIETSPVAQGAAGNYAPTGDRAPSLALTAEALEEKKVGAYACPAVLSSYVQVNAKDAMAVRVIQTIEQPQASGQQSQVIEQDYAFADGEPKAFLEQFNLNWQGVAAVGGNPPKQTVKAKVLLSKDHVVIGQKEQVLQLSCRALPPATPGASAAVGGGVAADVDLPKSVGLFVSPLGLKRIPGYSCPAKARVHGAVQSDDTPLTGTVGLFVNGSLVKQLPVDLPAKTGHNYDTDYELAWNASTQTEQTLNFTLRFANQHGYVVKTLEKQESFACQKIETSGIGRPDGLSNGFDQPVQQARPAAPGQLVLGSTFAIQAPKGTVKQGVIKLSGGKMTAKYTLKFFRKAGGQLTQVSAAQLPNAMKGLNAKFPLAALTGGRNWRLEVCPQGQGAAACKTTDFRTPAFGTKPGKTPQQKPKAQVIIIPGAVQ